MRLPLAHLVALSALLLLAGCHSRPGLTDRDREPLRTYHGPARSIVLPIDRPVRTTQQSDAYEPWYAGRRDYGPSVSVDRGDGYSYSVTITRDRQYISHGRVYDHYDKTTYRRTFHAGY